MRQRVRQMRVAGNPVLDQQQDAGDQMQRFGIGVSVELGTVIPAGIRPMDQVAGRTDWQGQGE